MTTRSASPLAREPLVHFLILGVLLFGLWTFFGESASVEDDRIVVSPAQIDLLVEGWKRTWQRPPTREELEGTIQDYVREEIYYREALAMGLDENDTIIRRRLRQKLEFLTEDVLSNEEPTEEELQSYLDAHPETFRSPPRLSFEHVYFSPDRRGPQALDDAETTLARLQEASERIDPSTLGDSLLLPHEVTDAPLFEIARQFGSDFAERLLELEVGIWQGPVESGFGLHLVRIATRVEPEPPTLDRVRDAVEREWRSERRREAEEEFYRKLRERYAVVIEWPEIRTAGTAPAPNASIQGVAP